MCYHTNGILADQRHNKPSPPRSAEELKKEADELMKKKQEREIMEFLKEHVR